MTATRALAGAIVSLCLVAPAHAGQGFYLSLEGGGGIVSDWEHTRTKWTWCGPQVKEALASFDTGWAAFGAVGYSMGQWRVEIEGGYRQNDVDTYEKHGWKGTYVYDAPGDLSEASAMVNVLYDVPLFERFSLSVGVGAGGDYAHLKIDAPWPPVDDGDWHFAYQGIAGVNYAVTDVMVVFVNYRYANVRDVGFEQASYVQLDGEELEKQTASAGLRFALAAPVAPIAAPPPATPQPVPLEREFMVFFGFNKWSLSPQALSTIKEAVVSIKQSGSAAIRVVGHTDRAGSVAYNNRLSLKRAKSVEKALIVEGIDADAISISGKGESEPMVPTADGVRESQNRRVHISF